MTFSDDALFSGVTTIKAEHLTELRQAVNAVRHLAGFGAATWTDASLSGALIKAVHVQELRDSLNQALAALSVTVTTFTDPARATGAGGTPIGKVHVEELRARATRGQNNSAGGGGGTVTLVPVDGGRRWLMTARRTG